MTLHLEKSDIPTASVIYKALADCYFSDCYAFHTEQKARKSLQIWLDHVSKTPAWVNFLMACRNNIVSTMGLKNLGHLGAVDVNKSIDDYKVGDRVGIFTLHFLSENEIILVDSDKHLTVKVSVYKACNEADAIAISTVVHVHNFLGKLYMLLVKPMHQLIVPSSIRNAESIQN